MRRLLHVFGWHSWVGQYDRFGPRWLECVVCGRREP